RLLAAPDPSRALLWMRQTGVLTTLLPESEKWGIDAIHGLVAAESDLGWEADPMLRLASIVPPDVERMEGLARRLKVSKTEALRLTEWAGSAKLAHEANEMALARLAYRGSPQGLTDRLRLSLAGARVRAAQDDTAMIEAGGFSRLLRYLEGWDRPTFPLKGSDLAQLGIAPGKKMGEILRDLEDEWIDGGFGRSGDALLERAAQMIDEA